MKIRSSYQQLQECQEKKQHRTKRLTWKGVLHSSPQVYPRAVTAASGVILHYILKKSNVSIWDPLLSVLLGCSVCGLGSGNCRDIHLVTVFHSVHLSWWQEPKDIFAIWTVYRIFVNQHVSLIVEIGIYYSVSIVALQGVGLFFVDAKL